MKYKKYVNIIIFFFVLYLSLPITYNPFSTWYVPASVDVFSENNPLYEEIKEAAKSGEFNEDADDAYIDSVWKKTPGRVGKKIDIEKSYEKMQAKGVFDKSLLEFKAVPPNISLKDLSASPIYRGHPDKDMVTLLINVSWGTDYVPRILEILKDEKVKANFFIEGKWARDNAELVKMIKEEGHLIGNHAYNHPDMARISSAEIKKQINQTNEIISAIIGEKPVYFAPPSGSYTDEVVQIAHQFGMETILWTTDTVDWKNPSLSVMMNRVNKNLHPGATILMHPTEVIVEGLDDLISFIKEKNYRIGRLDRLLSEDR